LGPRSPTRAGNPSIGRSRKLRTRSSIAAHRRLTWLPRVRLGVPEDKLGDAGHAERLDQLVDAAGRDALHVGFLDHRRPCLLRHSPRLQEAWEVAALPELGDAQLDRPGPRRPIPVAVAVALHQPARRALTVPSSGQTLNLELHQALGCEADHLAQEIGGGALLRKLAQGDAVVGHRGGLRSGVAGRNLTLREIPR
jgi:hypothetical protein